jgi:glycosyltransferase involved in cell wall biosynthesis
MLNKISEKKIKILYLITQSEFGGAQKYVFDLANSFKDSHNILVAYGEPGSNSLLVDKLETARIEQRRLPNLVRRIDLFKDLRALFEIIGLINEFRPDIIHLNSSKISILGSMAGLIARLGRQNKKLKIVYTVHGWVFNEPMSYWKKKFYIWAEKTFSHSKDMIICIDKYDYQLAKKIMIKKKKITVINHGLDIEKIRLMSKEDAQQILLKKFPICSPDLKPEIFIGAIGHLYATKGYEYLISAIKKVSLKQKNFALFIIGEGEERSELEEMIKSLRLENYVFLSGGLDRAADILPAFDIYACSSVKEGFPYCILEAMYGGLPIVSTNVGGIPDMVEHNINGLLVESKNPDQLSERILKLLTDKNLRKKLGEAARKSVLEKFKLNDMLVKTEKIYRLLIN